MSDLTPESGLPDGPDSSSSGTKLPPFLSTAEAAKLLGLSTTMVQSLMDSNELKGWKTRGGHRRITARRMTSEGRGSREPVVTDCERTPSRATIECNQPMVGNKGYDLKGQIISNTGTPVGSAFNVNTDTANWQWFASLAPKADGGFAVTWTYGDQYLGDYTVHAQQFDANGNKTGGLWIDTTAPATPGSAPQNFVDNVGTIQNAASTASVTDDTTPGLNIGAGQTDLPSLYVDGVKVAATYDPLTGILTPNSPLSSGQHALTYTLTDAAGNESGKSPALTVTVDTTVSSPSLVITSINDNYGSQTGTVAKGGTTDDLTPTVIGTLGGATAGTALASDESLVVYRSPDMTGAVSQTQVNNTPGQIPSGYSKLTYNVIDGGYAANIYLPTAPNAGDIVEVVRTCTYSFNVYSGSTLLTQPKVNESVYYQWDGSNWVNALVKVGNATVTVNAGGQSTWTIDDTTNTTAYNTQVRYLARVEDTAGNIGSAALEYQIGLQADANTAPNALKGSISSPLAALSVPQVSITDNTAGIALNNSTVTYTLSFSEAVTGLTESDLRVVNGTLVNNSLTQVNDTTWTVQATTPASGVGGMGLVVNDSSYTSLAGAAGVGGASTQQYGGASSYEASTFGHTLTKIQAPLVGNIMTPSQRYWNVGGRIYLTDTDSNANNVNPDGQTQGAITTLAADGTLLTREATGDANMSLKGVYSSLSLNALSDGSFFAVDHKDGSTGLYLSKFSSEGVRLSTVGPAVTTSVASGTSNWIVDSVNASNLGGGAGPLVGVVYATSGSYYTAVVNASTGQTVSGPNTLGNWSGQGYSTHAVLLADGRVAIETSTSSAGTYNVYILNRTTLAAEKTFNFSFSGAILGDSTLQQLSNGQLLYVGGNGYRALLNLDGTIASTDSIGLTGTGGIHVAALNGPDGGYVAVRGRGDSSLGPLVMRIYNNDGTARTGELTISSQAGSNTVGDNVDVIALPNGGFSVTYTIAGDLGTNISYGTLLVSTFDSQGVPQGADNQINFAHTTNTSSGQYGVQGTVPTNFDGFSGKYWKVGNKVYLFDSDENAGSVYGTNFNGKDQGAVTVIDPSTGQVGTRIATGTSNVLLNATGLSPNSDLNGNFWVVDNIGSTTTNMTLSKFNAAGQYVSSFNTGITTMYSAATWLTNPGSASSDVAVLYRTSTTLVLAKYSASGSLLSSTTVATGLTSNASYSYSMDIVQADGFVYVASAKDSGTTVVYRVDLAATSATSIATIATNGDAILDRLANGSLLVTDTGTSSTYKVSFIANPAGTPTVTSKTNTFGSPYYSTQTAALSDGGYVTVGGTGSTDNLVAQIYNADGTARGSQILIDPTGITAGTYTVVGLANGGFSVAYENSTGGTTNNNGALQIKTYGPSGNLVNTASAANTADTLVGTEGNDTLTANGGADVVLAGAGNDNVSITANNVTQLGNSNTMLLDGGTGVNTLTLADTGATLDLTNATVAAKVRSFSTIDLTGTGNNTLKLDVNAVSRTSTVADNIGTPADESRMMVVNGNGGDALQLVGSWTAGSATSGATLAATYGSAYGFVSGTSYTAYTLQGATVFVASGVSVSNNASASASVGNIITNGATVESLFGASAGVFSDVDSGQTFKGVAVVGNSSGYQYSTDGSTWTSLPTSTSDASAFYLAASAQLRYAGASGSTPPALTVRLVDSSGQTGTASLTTGQTVNASSNGGSTAFSGSTVQLVADTTAPNAPVISVYNDNVGAAQGDYASGTTTDDTTPTFKGTAEAGSTVKVYAGNTLLGTTNADGSGNWTFTSGTPMAQGAYAVTVSATDAAGNSSPASSGFSVNVDTNDAPSITSSTLPVMTRAMGGTQVGVALKDWVQANDSLDVSGAVSGFAVTGAGTNAGSYWQYYNGSSWVNITSASASASQAVFLSKDTLVRWGGTSSNYASFSVVAVDNSISMPAAGNTINVSTRGGETAFSEQVATLQGSLPPSTVQTITFNAPTSINEGNVLVGTVTLSGGNGNSALAYNLGGSATAADYASQIFSNGVTLNANGTLNVPAGVTSFTISLPIKADQTTEGPETLAMTVGTISQSVTINDTSVPQTPTNLTGTALTNGGYNVSYAGDVNGDGIDDFIVSAYPSSITANTKAYVVFGNTANLMPLNLSTMTASQGFAINDAIGGMQAVHYAGDLNGDGLADLIVGRPVEGSNSGAAYVVYGKTDGSMVTIGSNMGTSGFMMDSKIGSEQFGIDVSTAGDFNGDGMADLLVGAGASGGSAYVIYGNKNQSAYVSFSDLTSAGNLGLAIYNGGTGFGNSVTNLGDINGDGLSDVLVGGEGGGPGINYVVFGRTATGSLSIANLGTGGFKILGNATSEYAYQVAGAGDVNGDGIADFIIGARGANAAYVVYGSSSLAGTTINVTSIGSTVAGFKISASGGNFGYDVSYAGDLNGDGLADVVVGANNANANGSTSGSMYVVYGKANNTAVQASDVANGNGGFVINGPSSTSQLGYSVSNGGDLNGDGYDDLLVTAKGVGTYGNTYIVYGAAKYVTGYTALGTGTALDELVVGTAGNDTLTGGGGVDRFSAGGGNDTIVLQSTDVTNLVSPATGSPKAYVDGGAGYDTLRLNGVASLDFTGITNIDSMGGMGISRINSIERIDMATDTAANTLTLNARDVNDMDSVMNSVRLGLSADGRTWSSGTYTLQSTMKFNQLVIEGGSNDTLNLKSVPGSWALGGTVSNADGTYNVYTSATTNSQVFVKSGVVVNLNVAPIVLDMNGDGTFSYTQQLMDVNTDGKLDYSAWAAKQDGVLVWNKFGNGLVTDMSQYAFTLYGGNTDLEGLRAGFDSNGDGVFDANDAKFAQFGVWQDANGNGVSDLGEFRTLADLGVKAIHLSSDGVQSQPAQGVIEHGRTVVEMQDGSTTQASDASFEFDTAISAPSQDLVNAPVLLTLNEVQLSLDGHGASVANLGNSMQEVLQLNLADLMQLPTTADGKRQLLVSGDGNDGVTLANYLADGQTTGHWCAAGTVAQNDHTFNVYQYSGDQTLQVLIDQHIVQSQVHAS